MKRVPSVGPPAVPGDPAYARHAVHKNAAGAYLRCLFEEHAVCLLKLLGEHLARREDDLELARALERQEIPSQLRRVTDDLVGRHLEQDDDAGLVELRGTLIDELDAQRGL